MLRVNEAKAWVTAVVTATASQVVTGHTGDEERGLGDERAVILGMKILYSLVVFAGGVKMVR